MYQLSVRTTETTWKRLPRKYEIEEPLMQMWIVLLQGKGHEVQVVSAE